MPLAAEQMGLVPDQHDHVAFAKFDDALSWSMQKATPAEHQMEACPAVPGRRGFPWTTVLTDMEQRCVALNAADQLIDQLIDVRSAGMRS